MNRRFVLTHALARWTRATHQISGCVQPVPASVLGTRRKTKNKSRSLFLTAALCGILCGTNSENHPNLLILLTLLRRVCPVAGSRSFPMRSWSRSTQATRSLFPCRIGSPKIAARLSGLGTGPPLPRCCCCCCALFLLSEPQPKLRRPIARVSGCQPRVLLS